MLMQASLCSAIHWQTQVGGLGGHVPSGSRTRRDRGVNCRARLRDAGPGKMWKLCASLALKVAPQALRNM